MSNKSSFGSLAKLKISSISNCSSITSSVVSFGASIAFLKLEMFEIGGPSCSFDNGFSILSFIKNSLVSVFLPRAVNVQIL